MRFTVSSGERESIEWLRSKANCGHDFVLLAMLDKAYPKPKPFTWCDGHYDFKEACLSMGVANPRALIQTVLHRQSSHGAFCVSVAAYYKLIAPEQGGIIITKLGHDFLEAAKEWENETQG